MKRAAVLFTFICFISLAAFAWLDGHKTLVAAITPPFPEFPQPAQSLTQTQTGKVYFSSSTPFDMDVILNHPTTGSPSTGVGTLFLPEGASALSPVPAMVVLHGSGGISPGREMEYGQLLKNHGYAAFIVNYYAPRGVTDDTPYVMRIISVTEFDAMVDAYSALKLLSKHPAIDADRIGVMGFSYGGMATRFAMDERFRKKLAPDSPGFAAFVDYYGPCFQNIGTQKTNGHPLLTFRGNDDASNDLTTCKRREDELRSLGVNVEAHVFDGAAHGWEMLRPRTLQGGAPYIAGCEINYDSNGFSMIDDESIVAAGTETSREQRIAIRIASALSKNRCFKFGYIIGHDPITQKKSNRYLLEFLRKTLQP